MQEAQGQSSIRELGSHMPCEVAKKRKKEKKTFMLQCILL